MLSVKNGIDNIERYEYLLKEKRIGLITNHTGVNKNFISTIDIINNKFNLVSLFSPEHGIRGDIQAGEKVDTYIDSITGKKVYSLYGEKKYLSKEQLYEIDILVFDIQDVGARFYTYLYTLTNAMESCSKAGKEVLVLDRINPLGRRIDGNILDERFSSFVGKYSIPTRYGLTIGEFATYINTKKDINCKLTVATIEGWKGEVFYDNTDLIWIPPSPNMPTIDTALCYIGTCLLEGTNISEGRGTTKPFEVIGAPWIDSRKIIEKVKKYDLKGVKLRETYFQPIFSKYKDELCKGIAIHIEDRNEFSSYYLVLALINEIRNYHKNEFKWLESFKKDNNYFVDLLFGSNSLREGKLIKKIIEDDENKLKIFKKEISNHYIYK